MSAFLAASAGLSRPVAWVSLLLVAACTSTPKPEIQAGTRAHVQPPRHTPPPGRTGEGAAHQEVVGPVGVGEDLSEGGTEGGRPAGAAGSGGEPGGFDREPGAIESAPSHAGLPSPSSGLEISHPAERKPGPGGATDTAISGDIGWNGPDSGGARATAEVWGPAPGADGSAPGIVLPTAPSTPDLTLEMVDALKLPESDLRRRVVGMWEQVDGPRTADIAHGGYARNILIFRTDGRVDIIRFFGGRGEVRLNARLAYAVQEQGITFSVSTKSKAPVGRSLSLTDEGGHALVAQAPVTTLPATVQYSSGPDQLILGGRTFRRTKQSEPAR